jgi:predicted 3-demethylubiquinone-9 3-methyltransferase (glyoxalase superfamily)
MKKITPFLWFDDQAEEAATFYVSVFPNSVIERITRYGEAGPRPRGTVMTVEFRLDGQPFVALNGGPEFRFNPSVSFVVHCDTQEELDEMWARLSDGGAEVECGWLTDRYGLSWQVIPSILMDLIDPSDPERADRVLRALMKMKKLDLAALRKAADGD